MTIVRWDPYREIASMQHQVNRMFGDVYNRQEEDLTRGSWIPAVDIFENDKHELVLKAELPDVRSEDIDLRVENSTLTLKGERKLEREVKEEQFHRVERSYGSFSRSFTLPPTVSTDKVMADYKNGVLTVTLPLRDEAKPKQIQVQVTGNGQ